MSSISVYSRPPPEHGTISMFNKPTCNQRRAHRKIKLRSSDSQLLKSDNIIGLRTYTHTSNNTALLVTDCAQIIYSLEGKTTDIQTVEDCETLKSDDIVRLEVGSSAGTHGSLPSRRTRYCITMVVMNVTTCHLILKRSHNNHTVCQTRASDGLRPLVQALSCTCLVASVVCDVELVSGVDVVGETSQPHLDAPNQNLRVVILIEWVVFLPTPTPHNVLGRQSETLSKCK